MVVSGQRHARPRFSPGERTLDTRCTGGWVGPRAGLDTEDRGKLSSLKGIEPRSPGHPALRITDTTEENLWAICDPTAASSS
jgi:hypothetical protein